MVSVAATALASAACYALALVLAQLGLRRQSVVAGATISLPTTALVLWIVLLLRGGPDGAVDGPALAIFAGSGLFFPVAVTLLSFQGNRLLGPNLAGALGNATPLFAVAFGILILGDHLTPVRALGLAAVVGGVVMMSLRGRADTRIVSPLALAIPLVAAVIRGGVQPVVKFGLARWPDPLAATVAGYTVSALVILAIGFGRGTRPAWDRRAIPVFAAVGLLNGASVLLLYAALVEGRVSLVSPLVASYPLFTLAFSAAFLREERVHLRLALGIGLTVAGVAILLGS